MACQRTLHRTGRGHALFLIVDQHLYEQTLPRTLRMYSRRHLSTSTQDHRLYILEIKYEAPTERRRTRLAKHRQRRKAAGALWQYSVVIDLALPSIAISKIHRGVLPSWLTHLCFAGMAVTLESGRRPILGVLSDH